jgi:hypothetical protein
LRDINSPASDVGRRSYGLYAEVRDSARNARIRNQRALVLFPQDAIYFFVGRLIGEVNKLPVWQQDTSCHFCTPIVIGPAASFAPLLPGKQTGQAQEPIAR